MDNNLIFEGQFQELLWQIENIEDSDSGAYYIFAPDGITRLDPDIEVAVALLDTFGNDVTITLSNGVQLEAVIDVITLQAIVRIYLENHPNATSTELTHAANYYLNNDAYIE